MRKSVLFTLVGATLLSACSEQKKEPTPSVEQLAISTTTTPVERDDLRVIHRKRFQEKPVSLYEEKPVLDPDGLVTNLLSFKRSIEVKCVDILTLSDGSTRHVDCGQWEQSTGTINAKNGLTFSSTSRADSRGYSSYIGAGVSMSQVIRTLRQKNPPR